MADRRLVVTQRGTDSQKELESNDNGALYIVPEDGAVFQIEGEFAPDKVTNKYSIQAISEDATYKYFYFEDADLNWYILRKHKANNIFTYGAGDGGYASVYDSPTTGPDPAPTWGTYGGTF